MPFGLLSGRGRTCPARLWMVCGRRWEGRGPGMPGPYRAAAGMRAVLGRPVKAPPGIAALAHRSPSGATRHLPRIGGVCPERGGFLRRWRAGKMGTVGAAYMPPAGLRRQSLSTSPRGRGRACPALNINRKQVLAGKQRAGHARPLHLSNILPCSNGTRPRNGQDRSLQSTREPHL